jgi:hypothetical protein
VEIEINRSPLVGELTAPQIEVSDQKQNEKEEPKVLTKKEMLEVFFKRQIAKMFREWSSDEQKVKWLNGTTDLSDMENTIIDSQHRNQLFLAVMTSKNDEINELEKCKTALKLPKLNISFRDKQGNTALHYAAGMGRKKLVEILLDNGADETIKNVQGETPAKTAMMFDFFEIAEMLGGDNEVSSTKNYKKNIVSKRNDKWNGGKQRFHENKQSEKDNYLSTDDALSNEDLKWLRMPDLHIPPQLKNVKFGQGKNKATPFVADFNSYKKEVSFHRAEVLKVEVVNNNSVERIEDRQSNDIGNNLEYAGLKAQVSNPEIVYKKSRKLAIQ